MLERTQKGLKYLYTQLFLPLRLLTKSATTPLTTQIFTLLYIILADFFQTVSDGYSLSTLSPLVTDTGYVHRFA